MDVRRIATAVIITVCLGCSALQASGAPNVFGRLVIPKTAQERAKEEAEKQRDEFITDSLLNSITIDRATAEAYNMFSRTLFTPRVLGGLEESQVHNLYLAPFSFSKAAGTTYYNGEESEIIHPAQYPADLANPIPVWFRKNLRFQNQMHEAEYSMMVTNPSTIEYADWNLPLPPRLPDEDFSFHSFLSKLNLPEIDTDAVIIPDIEIKRRNWLHKFNVALQLSQAYVSSNWYQGGNSYVAGLFNLGWNVDLNTVFHPKLLFQSSLQYKLAVNSNPKGSLHKYNTSQDLFQYNLKTGFKAFNHWFYSLNLLFQTQFFNSYPDDSVERTSTLLSPGTFNLGLGMTYNLEKKGATLSVSISPLAYNLKTCLASDIDHEQFNIRQNRKTASEIGSSAEVNLLWKFNDNISWTSRLFLFTDYSYFLADWENTFNFQLNKFLSTQIYLHPRLDTSTENNTKWHHFMMREILSFGISYTFATVK